jgi:hypothetical protein
VLDSPGFVFTCQTAPGPTGSADVFGDDGAQESQTNYILLEE